MPTPPNATLVNGEPMQGAMSVSAGNFLVRRRLASVARETVNLLTRSEVEAIFKKEKGSYLLVSLELMPPYPVEVRSRTPSDLKCLNFRSLMVGEVIKMSMLCASSMGPFVHDTALYIRDFSKSLTDKLAPGMST